MKMVSQTEPIMTIDENLNSSNVISSPNTEGLKCFVPSPKKRVKTPCRKGREKRDDCEVLTKRNETSNTPKRVDVEEAKLSATPCSVITSLYSPSKSKRTSLYETPKRNTGSNLYKRELTFSTPPPSLRSVSKTPLSSRTLKLNSRSDQKKSTFLTPSRSREDRFIPNRSLMQDELCRASLLCAEKRRLALIDQKASERNSTTASSRENGDLNAPNQRQSTGQGTLTPLQSEFRLRMRGALLNIPLDHSGLRRRTLNASTVNNISERSLTRSSQENSENDHDLIYGALPEQRGTGNGASDSNLLDGAYEQTVPRILSFQGSIHSDDSLSQNSSRTRQTNDSSVSSKEDASQSRKQSYVTDPYYYDQLRVLNRSASSGRFIPSSHGAAIDMMSGADASFRDVANKVGRRINSAPTRILDAPELVDDYYLNLLTWSQDNTLAVALGQCVYLWDAGTGSIKHLLTLSGEEDYVTSVQWANVEGHSHYIAVGTNEGPVQM